MAWYNSSFLATNGNWFSNNNINHNGDRNFQQDNSRATEKLINYESNNMYENKIELLQTAFQKNSTGLI